MTEGERDSSQSFIHQVLIPSKENEIEREYQKEGRNPLFIKS